MINKNLIPQFSFYNPWWQTGSVPKKFIPSYKRVVFARILSYFKLNRAILVKGPRRVGKTTLLFQIIDNLLKKGADPRAILYGSFDDPAIQVPPERLVKVLESLTGKSVLKTPAFIFIDEAQFLPGWESLVKKYIDAKAPIHFIISGSSSSLLTQKLESLAGRTVEETMLPFSFSEYLSFKRPGVNQSEVSIYEKEIKLEWQNYLRYGGFPHLFAEPEELRLFLLRQDVVEKVIFRDLAALYKIKDPGIMQKLIYSLGQNTSGLVNLSTLASFLGLARNTVSQYISYLERGYLLFRLPKYSGRAAETLRSSPKIHLIDPGLAFLFQAPADSIFESVVASHLWAKLAEELYFWRDEFHEVDLFLRNLRIPIEVKNNDKIEIPSGLRYFMEKQKIKIGKVIFNGERAHRKTSVGEIEFIPAWQFLLEIEQGTELLERIEKARVEYRKTGGVPFKNLARKLGIDKKL